MDNREKDPIDMYVAFFSQCSKTDTQKHYLAARRGRKLSAAYTTDEDEAATFATESEGEAEIARRIDRDALPFKPGRGTFMSCCFAPQAE